MPRMHRICVMVLLSLPVVGIVKAEEDIRYLRSLEVRQGEKKPEVVCIGCSVRVAGSVDGDVVTVGGDIDVTGTVEGDAVASGGRIRLYPGSVVGGDAVAVGGTATRRGNAVVRGDLESYPCMHIPGQRSLHPLGVLTFAGVNVLLALIGGLVLRSRRSDCMADALLKHPLLSILSGLLLMALWILLGTANAKSRVAVAAVWTGHTFALVLLICGCTGIAWWIGRSIASARPPILKWSAGALAVSAILLVPVLGFVLLPVIMILALGADLTSGIGKHPDWLPNFRFHLKRAGETRGTMPGPQDPPTE